MTSAATYPAKARCLAGALGLVALCVGPLPAADKALPPAKAAITYPAVDLHANEKVAVAADPVDTREKQAIFQIDYLKAGFLPVRVIVTNSSDTAVKLDEVRAYFVTGDGDKLRAATAEDVERRLADFKDPTKRMATPFPLKGLGKPKNKDVKIDADFRLADFADLTVRPAETQSGYLFFDVSGMENPMAGAKLLVRGITAQDGTQLFYFEAPLDKYLAAKRK